MPPPSASKPSLPESSSSLQMEGQEYALIEIDPTGEVVLDVTFENTSSCIRSIPIDTIQKLRVSNTPFPSPRIFYRVALASLTKHSKYFEHLLGSHVFGEGRYVAEKLAEIAALKKTPSEIEAGELPRIKIVDEDDATRTLGREVVFGHLLRIVHGELKVPQSPPVTLSYITVLVAMADRYDCMSPVQRYIQGPLGKFKYPSTLDKRDHKAEDILRQKIFIHYHMYKSQQAAPITKEKGRFTGLAASTKELVMKGSSRWNAVEGSQKFTTAWWDLPGGLEAELSYRRCSILRTTASLVSHFLSLYTSRARQCSLGYDSSAACDSFQLGEMVKFLVKQDLLSLIPFQAVPPDHEDYVWPDAYQGDIPGLIAILRKVPNYQIDKNHGHCGLRSRITDALNYIADNLEGAGVGINLSTHSWEASSWLRLTAGRTRSRGKDFVVAGKVVGEGKEVFDVPSKLRETCGPWGCFDGEENARKLFTAEAWVWTRNEVDEAALRMARSSPFRF